jgi:hypothetical protein
MLERERDDLPQGELPAGAACIDFRQRGVREGPDLSAKDQNKSARSECGGLVNPHPPKPGP